MQPYSQGYDLNMTEPNYTRCTATSSEDCMSVKMMIVTKKKLVMTVVTSRMLTLLLMSCCCS